MPRFLVQNKYEVLVNRVVEICARSKFEKVVQQEREPGNSKRTIKDKPITQVKFRPQSECEQEFTDFVAMNWESNSIIFSYQKW